MEESADEREGFIDEDPINAEAAEPGIDPAIADMEPGTEPDMEPLNDALRLALWHAGVLGRPQLRMGRQE